MSSLEWRNLAYSVKKKVTFKKLFNFQYPSLIRVYKLNLKEKTGKKEITALNQLSWDTFEIMSFDKLWSGFNCRSIIYHNLKAKHNMTMINTALHDCINYSILKLNKSDISFSKHIHCTCTFFTSKTHWWKVKIQQKWNKKIS